MSLQRPYYTPPENLSHLVGRAARTGPLPTMPDNPPVLANEIRQYQDTMVELGALRKEEVELKAGEQAALRRDAEALAEAIQNGRKDPGPKHEQARQTRLAEVARRSAGLQLVAETQLATIRQQAAEHGHEWRTAHTTTINTLLDEMRQLLTTYTEHRAALEDHVRLYQWLTAPGETRWNPNQPVLDPDGWELLNELATELVAPNEQ